MPPRIAIAHDYLTQRGGAERVVLSLSRAFPDATIHTLFYEPNQTYPEFQDRDLRVSPLNRIGPLRRDPRLALPLLAPVASRMTIEADVVIASSSGWAHGFPTTGRKIVYCHSPARWLYLPEDYLGDAPRWDPKRLALGALSPVLKLWDRHAALGADLYLANSTVVQERIENVYGTRASTLFPPFSPAAAEGDREPIAEVEEWAEGEAGDGSFFLVVSRLQPYKNVDKVIEAFRSMAENRLLVIGRGPESGRIRRDAPPNVRFIEGVSDAQIRWAYSKSRALIAASHEDFGLTPLEAGSHGVPTIALRAGGYLDTIEEGVNGIFFDFPSSVHIGAAVRSIALRPIGTSGRIRDYVGRFSESRFHETIRDIASEVAEQ